MWRAIWISLIFQLGVSANFLGQSDTPISPALRDVIKKSHDQKDVIPIASFFLGLPYLANKLSNSSPENIYYSFNDFDCVTFVENVWALYYSKGIDRLFQKRLIQIRYQNQVSFEERQHYLTSALQKMVYLNLLSPLNNAKNSFKVYKDIHYLSTFLKKNNRNLTFMLFVKRRKTYHLNHFFILHLSKLKNIK